MQKVIYLRSTYKSSEHTQYKTILASFSHEWTDNSFIKRYVERRLETYQFEKMLGRLEQGDCVYVCNPAVFSIGVERVVEAIRAILDKGAIIRSALFGEITHDKADLILIAGEVVRECCEIDRRQEMMHNRGVMLEVGGYFEDGIWYEGQRKAYEPPRWAWHQTQRNVDIAQEKRENPAVRWIDMKIMQAWTTERIWAEYRDLCKIMPSDAWEKYGKQWINNRRLELIK